MPKVLSLFCLLIVLSVSGFCQVKETIDRDIVLIKAIPNVRCLPGNAKTLKKRNKVFMKQNPEFREVLLLDTLAIPYLIDKMSDTTDTAIGISCVSYNLKRGDVAFELLKDIVFIPMYAATGMQWDLLDCDSLCDYLYYLHHDRLKFQQQLRTYFASPNGKIWVRLLKERLSDAERAKLWSELKVN